MTPSCSSFSTHRSETLLPLYLSLQIGVEEQKLTSPATRGSFDFFGSSIAVDGDRIVVGEFPIGGEVGAAYVYRFDGASWAEEKTLTAKDGAGDDSITSVTLNGDVIVGGVSSDDENGTGAGAGYLFGL